MGLISRVSSRTYRSKKMASVAEKLAAMRAKLAAAQAKKNVEKLSERNMIEIIGKLKELGKLEVIPTTDARSYVTPKKLQSEIVENVNNFGYGRLSITELSEVLLVDFSIVEKHAEIGDSLSYSGRVTLSDLAISYDLPLKVIQIE